MSSNLTVITVDSPYNAVLKQKTTDFDLTELSVAKEINDALFAAITPLLPAAGLAAPQIGISRSIFIFSIDRDPKNLEVAINPTFTPLDDSIITSWEGCFSAMLCEKNIRLAKTKRHEKILATYLNLNGDFIERVLEGFGAKVFQHEYDHLQGIVNIYKPDSEVKSFDSIDEMNAFMDDVKKADSKYYKH